jgi:hypothetical protein
MKIKKWDLQNIVDVSSKLKTLNDILFKCYEAHVLRTKMIDSSKREIRIKQTIIVADMTKIHMILNLLWLKKLNSDIDWFSVIMRWRIENAKKIQKRIHAMIVAIDTKIIAKSSTKDDAQNKSSIENDTNLQDLNIAVVNQLTFEMYCKKKTFKFTFLIVRIYMTLNIQCMNWSSRRWWNHRKRFSKNTKTLQTSSIKWKQMNCQSTIRKIMK